MVLEWISLPSRFEGKQQPLCSKQLLADHGEVGVQLSSDGAQGALQGVETWAFRTKVGLAPLGPPKIHLSEATCEDPCDLRREFQSNSGSTGVRPQLTSGSTNGGLTGIPENPWDPNVGDYI